MLVIDGIKFNLHVPKNEEEFEDLVKEHLSEIFGKDSLYLDIKPELRSKAGIGSKPDGIVIQLDKPSVYIVEFELARHPVHDHVVAQISRFNKAIKSSETRLKMAEAVYSEVLIDPFKKALTESKVKGELFKFFTELFYSEPKLVVIVDEASEELKEAVEGLPFEAKIVEFKTFERENVGIPVHAHLFEPIKAPITEEAKNQVVAIFRAKPEGLEFLLKNSAWGYVRLPRKKIHYIAIHTTKPKQILYYGKVKEIISQEKHPTLAKEEEKGKYIILLEWVKQLENPIYGPGSRGMVYTTLDKLLHAKTTKEL